MPPVEPRPASPRKIDKGQLRAYAYRRLKDLFLTGRLGGEPLLSERELAKRLRMSNTPVRSAIERLESEGIVTISPQRGVAVRRFSHREICEHFELRTLLEPHVCRKIAGTLTPDQQERLRASVDVLDQSAAQGNLKRFLRIDTDFHLLLCGFHANLEVTRAVARLRDKINLAIVQNFALGPARVAAGCKEHRDIAEAIIAGDSELAAQWMLAHLEHGKRTILPGGLDDEVQLDFPATRNNGHQAG
jgi:DNA-binding GntR family transcriptional regulator